jgi:hypothetical protein
MQYLAVLAVLLLVVAPVAVSPLPQAKPFTLNPDLFTSCPLDCWLWGGSTCENAILSGSQFETKEPPNIAFIMVLYAFVPRPLQHAWLEQVLRCVVCIWLARVCT